MTVLTGPVPKLISCRLANWPNYSISSVDIAKLPQATNRANSTTKTLFGKVVAGSPVRAASYHIAEALQRAGLSCYLF